MAVQLSGLSRRIHNDEISAYVSHKLTFAGGSVLVDPDAFPALCESCQGISRTIDHIMSDALTLWIQMKHHTIDAEIKQRAVDSQSPL